MEFRSFRLVQKIEFSDHFFPQHLHVDVAVVGFNSLTEVFVEHAVLVAQIHVFFDGSLAVSLIEFGLHHLKQNLVLIQILGCFHLDGHFNVLSRLSIHLLIVVVTNCVNLLAASVGIGRLDIGNSVLKIRA